MGYIVRIELLTVDVSSFEDVVKKLKDLIKKLKEVEIDHLLDTAAIDFD